MKFSDWANQFTTSLGNLSNTVLQYKAGSAAITNVAQQPVPNSYIPQSMGIPSNIGGVSTQTILMVAAVGIIGLVFYKKFVK